MKNKGSWNVTGLKFENRTRTQSRTRSPIWRSLFSRILLQSMKPFWYKVAEISFHYICLIRLSVWRHHLVNLHILKTWISLERKEIFESSKQHFSAHEVYLFLFQSGLDRKDAIFVIVPLKCEGNSNIIIIIIILDVTIDFFTVTIGFSCKRCKFWLNGELNWQPEKSSSREHCFACGNGISSRIPGTRDLLRWSSLRTSRKRHNLVQQ